MIIFDFAPTAWRSSPPLRVRSQKRKIKASGSLPRKGGTESAQSDAKKIKGLRGGVL